jgi:3-oxoacyl-[acyl-carrier protein] reductase
MAFLITGATGPVAEPIIKLLADRGESLLLSGRNKERLADLEDRYGRPGSIETCVADVTEPAGAGHAVLAATRQLGSVDGLLHMVGHFQAGPVARTGPDQYEQALRVNFLSAVYVTAALLPHLGGGSRLVFFGTPLAVEPLPGLACYAASKAALTTWARSLSHEVKGRGIHVNVIMMTMADTPQARRERPHADFSEAVDPELVARTAGFLTSDASDGLYGSVVPVLGKFGFTTVLGGPPPPGPGRQ